MEKENLSIASAIILRWLKNRVSHTFLQFLLFFDEYGEILSIMSGIYPGKETQIWLKFVFLKEIVCHTSEKKFVHIDLEKDNYKQNRNALPARVITL